MSHNIYIRFHVIIFTLVLTLFSCQSEEDKESEGTLEGNVPISERILRTETPSLALGFEHSCALLITEGSSAGTNQAYCWGSNKQGQLGIGTSDTIKTEPAKVSGDHAFKYLSAGKYHSCGINTGGVIYCWGKNNDGQLGDGGTTESDIPVEVAEPSGGDSVKFKSLDLGDDFTCALSEAGAAYCWGSNEISVSKKQKLGVANEASTILKPTLVDTDLRFFSITSGGEHVCAVTLDQKLYCWGKNDEGQLGIGNTDFKNEPTEVEGAFLTVAAGETHTCAITDNGVPYCWGNNTYSELGLDSSSHGVKVTSPTAINLPDAYLNSLFIAVAAGRNHTCFMDENGKLSCVGLGNRGRLGRAGEEYEVGKVSASVDAVMTDELGNVSTNIRFKALSLGRNFSCASESSGKTYCWGEGENGQLGNASTDDKYTIAKIPSFFGI